MEGVATGRVAKETGGVRVAVELELNELGKRVAEPALRHPSVGCASLVAVSARQPGVHSFISAVLQRAVQLLQGDVETTATVDHMALVLQHLYTTRLAPVERSEAISEEELSK